MINNCVVCDSVSSVPFHSGLLKCTKCGHIFANLDLTDQEIKELYSLKYFNGEEYGDYVADRKIVEKNFIQRLKVLQNLINPVRHRHLLEIGCAYGFFLNVIRDKFETSTGIDVSEDGVGYACKELNLDVINDDFLKHDFGDKKFDLVCMWDTIEHLKNPDLYLEKLNNHMETDSLIAITTGDINSINARIKGEKWRLIHPPSHIHYFSGDTLTRILNRYDFDVVYNRHCGFHRSIDMLAYQLFVLQRDWNSCYQFLKKSRLTNLSFYLNLFDIMYVIARKR